jgi:hypothetical protein
MKRTTVRPGHKVPDSGIYKQPSGDRATLVEGKPAPPTERPRQQWIQVVNTNPKNDKK